MKDDNNTDDPVDESDDDFGADPFDNDPFDDEPNAEHGDDVDVRDRLEQEADRAVESFDEGVVDLLSWVLDTETRARIYVHLRQQPGSTSEEIADGTGLYPSTVREALAELHDEGKVTREKRENSGAGNNPYEYAAIAPSELVGDVVDDVQSELNTVFNLDQYLGELDKDTTETESEPVTISVNEQSEEEDDTGTDEGAADDQDHDGGTADDGDTDDNEA
jgi:predicted transcriptional regulator